MTRHGKVERSDSPPRERMKLWDGNLDGRFFRTALMLKLGEEIVLLQRSATPQQVPAADLPVRRRPLRTRFIRRFKLREIGHQRPRRNNQFQHGRRAVAQEIDQIADLRALLRRCGKGTPLPCRVRDEPLAPCLRYELQAPRLSGTGQPGPAPGTARRFAT